MRINELTDNTNGLAQCRAVNISQFVTFKSDPCCSSKGTELHIIIIYISVPNAMLRLHEDDSACLPGLHELSL